MEIVSKGVQGEPKFMIDNKVMVHGFRPEPKGMVYSMDYDPNLINKEDATILANKAVEKIMSDIEQNPEIGGNDDQ